MKRGEEGGEKVREEAGEKKKRCWRTVKGKWGTRGAERSRAGIPGRA